jgi:hypothetical protein
MLHDVGTNDEGNLLEQDEMRSGTTRLLCVAAGFSLVAGLSTRAEPVGTAFTYQGQLKEGGVPVDGAYDFTFGLCSTPDGPCDLAPPRVLDDLPVNDGLFTAELDFGAGVFTGDALWLEVAVRPGGSNGDHTVLTPRQPVAAAPYALYALDGLDSVGRYWVANGADIHNVNTGNVGIGTPAPAASLHVVNSEDEWAIWAQSPHGGVYGLRDATTGTSPGVQGETYSLAAEASGVRGLVAGTNPGPGSSGVRGVNRGAGAAGSGVWGEHWGGGAGVYGTCPDGIGVFGKATGGEGENIAVKGRTFSDAGYAAYFQGGKNYFEGNVGIGTTSPERKLDVVGGARFTGGDIRLWSGDKAVTLRQDSNDTFLSNKENFVNCGSGPNGRLVLNGEAGVYLKYGSDGSSGSDGLMIDASGNVGIGTTTPAAKLDVGGDVLMGETAAGAGSVETRGPNGELNASVAAHPSYPDNGRVSVCDSRGISQALMYVNAAGAGTITAEVKSFRVPYPGRPAEDIWYACVEGPEAAMYVRGTGQLVNGRATIELPEHFRVLAVEDGMTVQLTPRAGESMGLATGTRSLDSIEVVELHDGRGNYEFDWEVKAVRRAHQDFEVTRPWTHVMPAGGPSKDELWAARLKSIEQRERRVQEMESRLATDRHESSQ